MELVDRALKLRLLLILTLFLMLSLSLPLDPELQTCAGSGFGSRLRLAAPASDPGSGFSSGTVTGYRHKTPSRGEVLDWPR